MNRILFIMAFLLLSTAHSFCAEKECAPYSWLVMELNDGTEQSYIIPEAMDISTENDSISLTSRVLKVKYSLKKIKGYHFNIYNGGTSDISTPETETPSVVYVSKETVIIKGVDELQDIKLYESNGKELSSNSIRNGKNITINLTGQPKGVLIISLPGSAIPALKVLHE